MIYFILRIISIVFSLLAIFFGMWVITRTAGKLKKSIMFLVIAIIVLFLLSGLGILEIFYAVNFDLLRVSANILITIFIFLTVLEIVSLIKKVNGNNFKHLEKLKK